MFPLFIIDLGSYKTCCLLVEPNETTPQIMTVLGYAHLQSQGISEGGIIHLDKVKNTVQQCLNHIRNTAPLTFKDNAPMHVMFSVHCPKGSSRILQATVPLHGQPVSQGTLNKLMNIYRQYGAKNEDYLLHAFNLGYKVDDTPILHAPLQAEGENITQNLHAITVAPETIDALMALAEHCGLTPVGFVNSAMAPASICLSPVEKQRGSMVIDLGHETTKIAVYHHNQCLHTDSIPMGGHHISQDIAGLGIALKQAVRIKHHYARLSVTSIDTIENIDIIQNNKARKKISSSHLTGIVRPRVDEIFEMVQNCIERADFDHVESAVLTGGTSRLEGIDTLASQKLNKTIRVSRATNSVQNPPQTMLGNEFSTLYGLAQHAIAQPEDIRNKITHVQRLGPHLGHRTWAWIRDNF